MSEPRIIKKYPNRRLYDTAISSYITLEDVKKLVLENISIQVIDARSKNDITHNTLLQIILELEESGAPILTTEILQKMIRFYQSSIHSLVSRTMDQTSEFFAEQQALIKEKDADEIQAHFNHDPLAMMAEYARNHSDNWEQFRNDWVKIMQSPAEAQSEQGQTNEPTPDVAVNDLPNSTFNQDS